MAMYGKYILDMLQRTIVMMIMTIMMTLIPLNVHLLTVAKS